MPGNNTVPSGNSRSLSLMLRPYAGLARGITPAHTERIADG